MNGTCIQIKFIYFSKSVFVIKKINNLALNSSTSCQNHHRDITGFKKQATRNGSIEWHDLLKRPYLCV